MADCADEVADSRECLAELDEFVVDRADGGGAVGVGAVEGEVGLVEFADAIAVVVKEPALGLHVGFGFLDATFGEEFVDAEASFVHSLAKVEGGWSVVG